MDRSAKFLPTFAAPRNDPDMMKDHMDIAIHDCKAHLSSTSAKNFGLRSLEKNNVSAET